MALKLGELAHSLGFMLRMAQIWDFEWFFDHYREENLGPGSFSILWVLHLNPEARQGLVAETLRIKPAHMTKSVRRLEQRGLVKRIVPDDDRRSVLLSLTPQGRQFIEKHRAKFIGADAARPSALSKEEAAELTRLLAKMCPVETSD